MTHTTRPSPRPRHYRPLRALVALLVLAAALLAANAAASTGPSIRRYSFAGGGASASVGDLSLRGHVGEALAGSGSSGSVTVAGGFWAAAAPHATPTTHPTPTLAPSVYIPITVKEGD